MLADPTAILRLTIDREALAANWRALDALSGNAATGAAVKADCYGLGVDMCMPALRDAGCEQYFVAHWSEVAAVSRHVPPGQISVLHGVQSAQDADYALQTGAVPVINSPRQAALWNNAGGGRCHLMIDSGINRLGLAPDQIADPDVEKLDVDILMSHLACADEDSEMNAKQLATFRAISSKIQSETLSLANSAGIALGADYHFDLTRPGLSLYGGIPRPELGSHIKQVAYPQAAIMQVRDIAAGETVGYNARFTATHDMRVGVVSLGYADGLLRSWGDKGHLLHGDSQLPMLGTISMDMTVVDLSAAPELREGDWVSLPYSLKNAAQQSALSQYELLTVLGTRFARSDG